MSSEVSIPCPACGETSGQVTARCGRFFRCGHCARFWRVVLGSDGCSAFLPGGRAPHPKQPRWLPFGVSTPVHRQCSCGGVKVRRRVLGDVSYFQCCSCAAKFTYEVIESSKPVLRVRGVST